MFGLFMGSEEEAMLRVVMQRWRKRDQDDTNTKVARQHLSPPERTEHISERSPQNEMFRDSDGFRTRHTGHVPRGLHNKGPPQK